MSAYETKPFDSAIEPICMRIKEILYELPLLHQQAINEIRLRVGRPVTLHTPTRVDILKHNGQPIVTEKQDIEESYRRICDFSIYFFTFRDILNVLRMFCAERSESHG